MNPLTNARNQQELSERELHLGVANSNQSWHSLHKNSAYVYAGGLPYDLSEGDIICVFSQYGEIVDINLIRDKATGKSKGFCFLAYEDQRSTILAVDNLNTAKVCNRQIRVQHVSDYKATQLKEKDLKDSEKSDWVKLQLEGVAPKAISNGHGSSDSDAEIVIAKKKKSKKEKKEKKTKKNKDERKQLKREASPSFINGEVKVKKERRDHKEYERPENYSHENRYRNAERVEKDGKIKKRKRSRSG